MNNNPVEKKTILIVDDKPENISVLAAILKETYRIKIAANGKRALELAASDSKPDLILLDIVMPEMDGYEVCKHLKENPDAANIPVIFTTALEGHKDEEKGLQLGAEDFINKPYSPAIIKKRVATHIELKHYRDVINLKS